MLEDRIPHVSVTGTIKKWDKSSSRNIKKYAMFLVDLVENIAQKNICNPRMAQYLGAEYTVPLEKKKITNKNINLASSGIAKKLKP